MNLTKRLTSFSINSYGNAPVIAQKTHDKFPGKPIFISEVGIKQISPAPDGVLRDDLFGYLREFPWVTGVSIWSYYDY